MKKNNYPSPNQYGDLFFFPAYEFCKWHIVPSHLFIHRIFINSMVLMTDI